MANDTQSILSFLQETKYQVLELLDKELVFDEEVDSWFLMSTPWPIISIIVVYLLFVLKIGPNFMKDREPYKLKNIMLCYNIFQTIYNAFILYWLFFTPGSLKYLWNHSCHPIDRNENQFLLHELNKGSWYFFLSKVVDLLDTIFFVLRKKQSQVTFLHVYHHSNMAVTCWAYLRFIKGEQATLPGVINSFIHTVMYFYYFLAALGPQMQPYLWWKKYLTRMQIIQFVIIMVWYVGLLTFNCEFPKVYMCYMAANVGLFLYLFSLFYSKTYAKKPKIVKTN
ncbi:ELO family,ELO family, conserved site [Cinara cedri]|uniref:Elongation of very long chain fatty acids protein n=1 Tax=Cinara cedri TaxID=506608 RepID=A0A5E4M7Q1_9HEMI|nr:ELO family,ELO family, conserved site [Cinara cedri]